MRISKDQVQIRINGNGREKREEGVAANCTDPGEKHSFNASFTDNSALHLDAHLMLSYSASVPMIW